MFGHINYNNILFIYLFIIYLFKSKCLDTLIKITFIYLFNYLFTYSFVYLFVCLFVYL